MPVFFESCVNASSSSYLWNAVDLCIRLSGQKKENSDLNSFSFKILGYFCMFVFKISSKYVPKIAQNFISIKYHFEKVYFHFF